MFLILYLLISGYFGKRNPFFYLIIAFALQQGPGSFIDQSVSISGKNLFSVNDTIFSDFLFFMVFLISLFLIKIKFPKIGYFGSRMIVLYFIYLFTLFAVDCFTYKDSAEVLLTSRNLLYIPLAYLLWSSIYQSVSRSQYEAFLKILFYITPVSALLYVLNSSGILTLYPREIIYSEVEMEPTNSLRDFATIPIFLIPVLVISVQSLLMTILKIKKYIIYINLIILPIALLFTFTRSLFIMVFMQLIIMTVFYCINKGLTGMKQVFIFIFLLGIFCFSIYLTAKKVFPGQVEYFASRFLNVSDEGLKEQNVDIRITYLNKAIQITNYTSPAFGAGMNREHYQELNNIGAWAADSTIPFFLYHSGWVGVVFLYLILIGFSIDSMIQYFKTGDWLVAYLASNFITLTVSSLLMGGLELNGSVWTFMNLALYTTTKFRLWKREIIYFAHSNLKTGSVVKSL